MKPETLKIQPQRGAVHALLMASRYSEKVKPAKRFYTKSDRKQNKVNKNEY